jgi:hypothetical protein
MDKIEIAVNAWTDVVARRSPKISEQRGHHKRIHAQRFIVTDLAG